MSRQPGLLAGPPLDPEQLQLLAAAVPSSQWAGAGAAAKKPKKPKKADPNRSHA
eukprot:CAMPEP_0173426064 /NCGR_PEP_ID=MMETSP1357-20121228/5625_1 /TAXON_ID=77926 /ORGANISM="Hemiselmis rufescens, Strain PCC563" /LENGTH=53 /DNA_ID=CAMNT_0014389641 /DNA_START=67 /DNA_END=228 /DNA_ORIENTATION=-